MISTRLKVDYWFSLKQPDTSFFLRGCIKSCSFYKVLISLTRIFFQYLLKFFEGEPP